MNVKTGLIPLLLFLSPLSIAAPPQAQDDIRTVRINRVFTIDVLNNDSDPDGDNLILAGNSLTQPQNGTVSINSGGGIQYTPNANFVGVDTFTYGVVDDSPAQEQSIGTVIVNVVDSVISASPSQPNERTVATALESACNSLGDVDSSSYTGTIYSAISTNCESLLALFLNDPEAAFRAVQQIAPEEALSLAKVGSSASDVQAKMIANRLMQLGQDVSNTSQAGLSWSGDFKGASAGEGSILSKVGFFASLQLEDAEKERSDYESGFEYSSNGLTVGLDYALSHNWFAGGAFGFTSNKLQYSLNGGTVESDIVTFIVYNTVHLDNLSFDFQAGLGNSSIDISRNIQYGSGETQFSASTLGTSNGSQEFLRLQLQYMWAYKSLSFYPSFLYSISNSQVSEYADNRAGGWEVVIGEQNVKQQKLEAGLQGSYALKQSWGVIIPSFDLTAISDLDTDQDILYAQFAFSPDNTGQFTMYGDAPESLYYLAGAGFSLILPNGTSAFFNVNKTLGYLDYSSTRYQAGIRLEF